MTGTYAGAGRAARSAASSSTRSIALATSPGMRTSTARGRAGSRRRKPFFCSIASWCETLLVLVRPTASPISRTVGG